MTIGLADIEAIIARFEASDWRRIELIADGIELRLAKDPVGGMESLAPLATATPMPMPAAPAAAALPGRIVSAPSLGTFYRSPKPGEPPFVEAGGRVAAGEPLCIIEVMKLMTIVAAPVAGRVIAFHVADAALVEFEQPLVSIQPDD